MVVGFSILTEMSWWERQDSNLGPLPVYGQRSGQLSYAPALFQQPEIDCVKVRVCLFGLSHIGQKGAQPYESNPQDFAGPTV
jgi:hypothetical protein